MNLLHLFHRFEVVILLDAVDFDGDPGDIRFFTIDDVISKKNSPQLSTHHIDVLQIISFAKKIGECPDHIYVFGVQPEDVSFGEGFTQPLESKKDEFVCLLLEKVSSLIKQYC